VSDTTLLALPSGTPGNINPGAATNTAAVTGTTGVYAKTGGVLVSKDTEAGADETITLVD
jgi:hypothetical protein